MSSRLLRVVLRVRCLEYLRPHLLFDAEKLFEALHNIDFSDYEPETVYLSREYELEYLTE